LFNLSPSLPLTSHCLIMGLVMSCSASMLLTLTPSPIICAAIRLMVPLSYAAIFSCMLVKFSFLIILTKEQHLSSGYQIFSLILLISVQLVVSSYLFIANKPDIIMEDTNFQGIQCATSYEDRLHSHLYNLMLLSVTVLLYLRHHHVRTSYIEAQYVGITSLLSGPVMLAWVVSGLTLEEKYQELCIVLGLLINISLFFILMFVIIRCHKENNGFSDCYKQSKNLSLYSFLPSEGPCHNLLSYFGVGRFSPSGRSLSQGNLLEDNNIKNIQDLTAAVSGAISSGSESESSADVENSKPYAGYRRTNSFDRFPFMSRPLRSAHRPCSTVPSGTGVQSLTNPNVLFCTTQDVRRATLSRY